MTIIAKDGADSEITSSEINAYRAAKDQAAAGLQTAAGQNVETSVDVKVAQIAGSARDSGGSGNYQAAVMPEVMDRAAELQGNLAQTIRTWAKPGHERGLLEMFGQVVGALVEKDKLLLELRERLNNSPY